MDIVILLLKQNFVMLLYLLIGFFLFRKKLVGTQGSADMGRVLLYIVMPAAILKSYLAEFSMEKLEGLAISFILSLLSLLLAILVSRLIFHADQGIERFGAAFSNAGFIGIPLVQMTLGDEAVFYISSFVALLNIFQWTYGLVTMTGRRDVISFAKIRTNPIVLSFIGGLLLFFLPISLPDTLLSMLSTVASMNAPLAMIVLGIYLAQLPLHEIFTDKTAYLCAFVRLILIPVLTMLLMLIFPDRYYTMKLAILIAAAAPVGSNVAIFAQIYERDYTQAVKEVCLSTLLCIITLPLLLGLAGFLL